jgi:hypothetical protein
MNVDDASHVTAEPVKNNQHCVLDLKQARHARNLLLARTLARAGYGWEDINRRTGLAVDTCKTYAVRHCPPNVHGPLTRPRFILPKDRRLDWNSADDGAIRSHCIKADRMLALRLVREGRS